MERETMLVGMAALVVVASLGAAAAIPGALADLKEPERPGYVDIREVQIAPGTVSGSTAELSVEARLTHRGGPAENVTVLFRAIDARSGLLETSREVDVGTISDEREVAVTGNLTVERQGGYRIVTVVYRDGQRMEERATEVAGVGSLQPAYARSTVGFHRFGETGAALPVIEYSIAGAEDNLTSLRVSSYLTNTGDEAAGGLELVVKARQADSHIVADETTVEVGEIAPGRTETPTAELSVPDGYNYYLDAVLWKDGVIVGTARSAANLDPTERLSVNETRRAIGLEVRDFERDVSAERPERTPAATEVASGQPGFTALAALVAMLAGALVLWRRSP